MLAFYMIHSYVPIIRTQKIFCLFCDYIVSLTLLRRSGNSNNHFNGYTIRYFLYVFVMCESMKHKFSGRGGGGSRFYHLVIN